ncbi:hypothetical protein RvY_05762 [Ramazzottius varieornatus]|uniref:Uncharacterized protein n=1 Tax=Ramazzottius varieornatus TaxID=947166 RepID=A0A1D1UW65_RAMVA|nr:hypothetical protein RvY_05762 [Ramazzottius varieornatus]
MFVLSCKGYFYGTIYPFYRQLLDYQEDHWQFFPREKTTTHVVVPFRGRRASFKKAIGMIANLEEEVAVLDIVPRP